MPLVQLTAPPGVITDITDYQAQMRYTNADKVRFFQGFAEKIGGWTKRFSSSQLQGQCRKIFPHRDTDGSKFIFMGTSTHFFVEYSGQVYDITPFRTDPITLTNPYTTGSAGSNVVTVTHANHGLAHTDPGSRVVVQSAVTFDGVTIAAQEYVATFINSNQYSIVASSGTASSGSQTGGGSITLRYLTNNGPDDGLTGYGFGAGVWGASSWGTARSASGVVLSPRVWSIDAFGEDIVASVGGGEDTIYYFDVSAFVAAPDTFRGTTLAFYVTNTLSGDASQIPTKVGQVLVSTPDRHLVVFGSNPQGSSVYDRMTIRFSDQESLSTWNAQITNTAGEQRLGTGTNIEAVEKGRGQIFVWTDADVYSMQFIGPPFTFSFSVLGEISGTISKNAATTIEGAAFWMGVDNFYMYDGAVRTLPCPVLQHVFDDFNQVQREKVFAGQNIKFNEIWWFYPSAGSDDIDKYIIYNYIDNNWSIGTLGRTAWVDSNIFANPLAVDKLGLQYNHESGTDDAGSAITAFVETGFFNGDANGDNLYFVNRVIPDVTYSSGTNIKFTLKTKVFPQDTEITKGPFTISNTDNRLDMRARGRSFQARYETDATGVAWRLGTWRAEGRTDGAR
mgnify:FL=1|tara:strand:- start:16164 stop:18017 length:1854 start_codon:yes stop_codon:yes gene_type:complete